MSKRLILKKQESICVNSDEFRLSLMGACLLCQETSGMSVVEEIQHATEKINEILAYDREELNNDDMKEVVAAIHPVRHELSRLLSKDRLKEGMKQFLRLMSPR